MHEYGCAYATACVQRSEDSWECELSPFTICALGMDIKVQMSLLSHLASLFVHVFV